MSDKLPRYVKIEIDEKKGQKMVFVRFSKHHNRKHAYELDYYEEHAGVTTIMLKKSERTSQ